MPFRFILADLLAASDGALAAVFVDEEGETVDLVCARGEDGGEVLDPAAVRVAGAYLGLLLRQARGALSGLELGAPRLLHLERGGLHFHATALPDGYLLALIQRRPALCAPARGRLAAAAGELERALFTL